MRAITPADDGGVEVRLPVAERDLLRSMPEQLRAILSGDVPVAGVRSRLFPRAYDDETLDAEYQEIMGADLEEQRIAAVDRFAATLDDGHRDGRTWSVALDAESALAWLSALNDARLVLAAAVGIEEERDWENDDGGDPSVAALRYLGWAQEALIAALSGRRLDG